MDLAREVDDSHQPLHLSAGDQRGPQEDQSCATGLPPDPRQEDASGPSEATSGRPAKPPTEKDTVVISQGVVGNPHPAETP